MIQAIRREFRLHWQFDLILLCVLWGVFALSVGGVILIMTLTGSETYAEMGCFLVTMATLIALLIRFVLWNPYGYYMAVSMGRTRVSAMLGIMGHSGAVILLCGACLWLFHLIESSLYATLYPQYLNEISFADVMKPGMLIMYAFVLWAITFFLSGVVVRFGRKGWWIVWAAWMFGCLVLPRLLDSDENSSLLARVMHTVVHNAGVFLGAIAPWCGGRLALPLPLPLLPPQFKCICGRKSSFDML